MAVVQLAAVRVRLPLVIAQLGHVRISGPAAHDGALDVTLLAPALLA
jgi:hypothetical protein